MSIDNEQDSAHIGGRLCMLRQAQAMTQGDFARELNVSLRTYQNYERGERPISQQVLSELAIRFGVHLNWLLTGVGEREDSDEFVKIAPPINLNLFEDIACNLDTKFDDEARLESLFRPGAELAYYAALIYNRVITTLKPTDTVDELDELLSNELAYLVAIKKRNIAGEKVVHEDEAAHFERKGTKLEAVYGISATVVPRKKSKNSKEVRRQLGRREKTK